MLTPRLGGISRGSGSTTLAPGDGFGLTELQAGDGVSTSVMAASRLGTMGSNRWAANAPVAPRPQGRAAQPDHQRTAGAGGASTGRRVSGSGQRLPVMAIGGTGIGFRGGDSPRAVAAAGAGGDGASAPSPTSLGCGGPPGRSAATSSARVARVSALAAERSGRWLERGRLDAVIAEVLFMAGMRRSEVSARPWADGADAADGDGVLVTVRRSKTNQEGEVRDVRFVKGGVARAIRTLRAAANLAPGVRVAPLSPKMVRLQFRAAARAAGVEHVTAHREGSGWRRSSRAGKRRTGAVERGPGPQVH